MAESTTDTDVKRETPQPAESSAVGSGPQAEAAQDNRGKAETERSAGTAGQAPKTAAHDAELKDASPKGGTSPLDLDFILDIPLNVTVEVGRTRLMIRELLQLGQGSVIELDKLMGEPFEVLVNEKLIARGEIVVVNDRFGVRLTDIVSASERVQSLG